MPEGFVNVLEQCRNINELHFCHFSARLLAKLNNEQVIIPGLKVMHIKSNSFQREERLNLRQQQQQHQYQQIHLNFLQRHANSLTQSTSILWTSGLNLLMVMYCYDSIALSIPIGQIAKALKSCLDY